MNLVIFISGTGSNMVALADAVQNLRLKANIVSVICDNPKAKGIKKAQDLGLDTQVIEWKNEPIKTLITQLKAQADYIILAGFMRLLPEYFVDAFKGRIINIHPSLLPKYKGLNAIERAYDAKDQELGISIHYVDKGMDTGPVIAQFSIQRDAADSLDDIEKKIHQLEHQYYWQVIQKIIEKKEA